MGVPHLWGPWAIFRGKKVPRGPGGASIAAAGRQVSPLCRSGRRPWCAQAQKVFPAPAARATASLGRMLGLGSGLRPIGAALGARASARLSAGAEMPKKAGATNKASSQVLWQRRDGPRRETSRRGWVLPGPRPLHSQWAVGVCPEAPSACASREALFCSLPLHLFGQTLAAPTLQGELRPAGAPVAPVGQPPSPGSDACARTAACRYCSSGSFSPAAAFDWAGGWRRLDLVSSCTLTSPLPAGRRALVCRTGSSGAANSPSRPSNIAVVPPLPLVHTHTCTNAHTRSRLSCSQTFTY